MSMIVMMIGFFLFMVIKNKNYLLSCLLSLEGLMLMILCLMVLNMYCLVSSYSGLLMFMFMVVSEGGMGLGLLVLVVRGIGKDNFFFQNFV